MGDLSEHFSRHEFACKCGCGLDAINPKTVKGIEKYRALLSEYRGKDTPVTPNSACRCEWHNAGLKSVAGAKNSQHLPKNGCRAVDIPKPRGMTVQAMYELLVQVPEFEQGGIITYDWGCHCDTRLSGRYRENKRGKK